jgi:uncharacterized protein YktA (UPF0223 family)
MSAEKGTTVPTILTDEQVAGFEPVTITSQFDTPQPPTVLTDEQVQSFEPVTDQLTPEEFAERIGVGAEPETKTTRFEAAMQGFTQGATAGFADEILGVVATGWDELTDDQQKDFWSAYRDNQQLFQERAKLAAEEHPAIALASDVVGGIALGAGTILATGGAAAPLFVHPAGLAAIGALEGVGRSEGVVDTPEGREKILRDAGMTALAGATFGLGFKALGKGMNKLTTLRKSVNDDSLKLGNQINDIVEEQAEDIAVKADALTGNKWKLKEAPIFVADDAKDFTKFQAQLRSLDKPEQRKLVATFARDYKLTKEAEESMYSLAKKSGAKVETELKEMMKDASNRIDTAIRAEMGLKGITGSPQEYKAYKLLRKEQQDYAFWLTKMRNLPGKYRGTKRQLASSYTQRVKGGEVTPDSYLQFRKQQAANTAIAQSVSSVFERVNPNSVDSWLVRFPITRYFMDLRYVFSEVDNKIGTRVAIAADDLVVANNKRLANTLEQMTVVEGLAKETKNAGLEFESVRRLLDNAVYRRENLSKLTQEQTKVLKGWESFFKDTRSWAQKRGLTIKERKLYAPLQQKEPSDLVVAVTRYADRLKQTHGFDISDPSPQFNRMFGKLDDPAERAIQRQFIKNNMKVVELKRQLERMYGERINTLDDMTMAYKNMDDIVRNKANAEFQANATFKRQGYIPDAFRENNIVKLAHSYVNNLNKSVYLTKPLRELEVQRYILSEAKADESARYLQEFIDNAGGVSSGMVKMMSEFRTKFKINAKKRLDRLGVTDEYAEVTPEVLSTVAHSIYPNMLGLNPKAILRNYTQPFVMTGTHLGGSYGYKIALQESLKVIGMQARSGKNYFSVAKRYLTKRGLAPVEFVGENLEAINKGTAEGLVGMPIRFVKKQSQLVMKGYSHSDYQNRMVTVGMAKRVTKDIVNALKTTASGGKLSDDHRVVMSFLDKMEPAYRSEIRQLISKNQLTPDKLERLLSQYLLGKTQFFYGKLGLSQFGRQMGPIFSMFTKWPASIGSEMVTTINQRGLSGAADMGEKYLFPLVALSTISTLGQVGDTPREQEIFSKRGLTYWAPVNALETLGGVTMPPLLSTAADVGEIGRDAAMTDIDPGKSAKRLKSWSRESAKKFMPMAVWWNGYNRFYRIILDEEPN